MDPKSKIALAVVAGVVGGMLLLGTALAVPTALRAIGRTVLSASGGYDDGYYGMMGPRGMMGRGWQSSDEYGDSRRGYDDGYYGMMGPRGMMGRGWQSSDEYGDSRRGYDDGYYGMMGPRGYAPQGGCVAGPRYDDGYGSNPDSSGSAR